MLKKWDKLPDKLQKEEIRPYYEALRRHNVALFLKRVFDFIVALILLVILLPILLILSLLVGVTSPGGVFFCQTRVTTYGRQFRIIKFRTMVSGAEKLGTQVTMENDARITKVGGFLRKLRIDELPQLVNIIKGDMSLVGTRPEVPRYVERYTDEMLATLLLPAGVTSEASIEYKDENELLDGQSDVDHVYVTKVLPEKMKYNLRYVESYSFLKDVKLLARTVVAVLH